MRRVLPLLLTMLSTLSYGKNGETGVLIEVNEFRLLPPNSEVQTLVLCELDYNQVQHFQRLGLKTNLQLKELGTYEIEDRDSDLALQGYITVLKSTECEMTIAQ